MSASMAARRYFTVLSGLGGHRRCDPCLPTSQRFRSTPPSVKARTIESVVAVGGP